GYQGQHRSRELGYARSGSGAAPATAVRRHLTRRRRTLWQVPAGELSTAADHLGSRLPFARGGGWRQGVRATPLPTAKVTADDAQHRSPGNTFALHAPVRRLSRTP